MKAVTTTSDGLSARAPGLCLPLVLALGAKASSKAQRRRRQDRTQAQPTTQAPPPAAGRWLHGLLEAGNFDRPALKCTLLNVLRTLVSRPAGATCLLLGAGKRAGPVPSAQRKRKRQRHGRMWVLSRGKAKAGRARGEAESQPESERSDNSRLFGVEIEIGLASSLRSMA